MKLIKSLTFIFCLIIISIPFNLANAKQTKPLIIILADPNVDYEKKIGAARQLGNLNDERAIVPLIVLVKQGNFYASLALRKMKHEGSIEPLIKLLKEDNAFAADILGKFRNKRALNALLQAAQDSQNWQTRRSALKALSGHKTIAVIKVFVTKLLTDQSKWVRRTAAYSLVDVKDTHVIDAFIKALKDSDDEVRRIAKLALGYSNDPKAKRALLNF